MDEPRNKDANGLAIGVLFLAMLAVLFELAWLPGAGAAIALLALFGAPAALAIFSRRWRGCGCAMVIALLLLEFLLPNIGASREAPRRVQCTTNLKQTALAIKAYEQQHGHFPPAYLADKNGKPIHSWRVLLLPYLEGKALYDAYRFDEPWDGPNNRKLADKCPEIFRCPSGKAAGSPSGNTSYVAIVGPHAAWTGEKGVGPADFPDGRSNTILVVEMANSGINWLDPRDLYVGQMARTINPKAGQGISSKHTGGANVTFADESARCLPEDLPPETLDALITRDGGEDVDVGQY